ncbi:WD repeat-containing protein [Lentinula raphanica]|nr:WD repeat-containing protein [Lentinula raphanica]
MHVSMGFNSYSSSFSTDPYLNQPIPTFSLSTRIHKRALSRSLARTWDRVQVLGDNRNYGHAGCVNALHWARGGELLLSAGDDTTVQIWKSDPTNTLDDYPFVCRTVIHTGHSANIFNTAMLPSSNRIVTVAGDRQVRVFDLGKNLGRVPSAIGENVRPHEYYASQAMTNTLRCHEDRVKRIVTEESPDRFLTVSEAIRQHDLRTQHVCRNQCPTPLLQVHHELSTLATSGYYCVVAGDSPYGYLFDRRFTGRKQDVHTQGLITSCVRRFGRAEQRKTSRYAREHITGARMSAENGHEVLLSYSADGVYLFSTLDDPESSDGISSSSSSIISPNLKRRRHHRETHSAESSPLTEGHAMDINEWSTHAPQEDTDDDQDEDENEDEERPEFYPWVDTVRPLRRFSGARNVETVKDVNFLGPRDEYVTSGSDDGNFFVWHKNTGRLHGLYEGDGSVVNVIEGHPHLPLVAVSGIDYTIKLFAPVNGESKFSRMSNAESIMEKNRMNFRSSGIRRRMNFIGMLEALGQGEDINANCVNQ